MTNNKYRPRGLLLYLATLSVLILVFVHIPRNTIVVADQPVGTTIFFKRITMVADGYIVFFQKDNTGMERLVGHSDLFPAGIYTKKHILPFWRYEDKFEPGELRMVLYRDKGDLYFDEGLDTPVLRFNGQTLSRTIILK